MENARPVGGPLLILRVEIGGRLHQLTLEQNVDGESFVCEIDGARITGSARLLAPGILSLLLGRDSYRCVLGPEGEESVVYVNGERIAFRVEDPRSLRARRSHGGGENGPHPLKAPMPGRVIRFLVEKGAKVEAQQGIVVIEAMKMQNELKTPKAGRVAELRGAAGSSVNAGEVLAIIE
jgi:biotin carboxyl carrier protein